MSYGTDGYAITELSLLDDISDEDLALIQACCRRLITPRGALTWAGDPNYGTDIRQFIADAAPAGMIASAIVNELEKEEAVDSTRVEISKLLSQVTIKVLIVRTDLSQIRFSFALTSESINLLTAA